MEIQKHIVTTQKQDIQIEEVTLLSKEEYHAAKENIPPEPRFHGWWWLRSPGRCPSYAASVGRSGSLRVDNVSVCVRPALRIINLNSSKLCIGDKFEMVGFTWTVVLEEEKDFLALCDTSVGETCFREDWDEDNANEYEASDVKKWLANWAGEHGIKVKR